MADPTTNPYPVGSAQWLSWNAAHPNVHPTTATTQTQTQTGPDLSLLNQDINRNTTQQGQRDVYGERYTQEQIDRNADINRTEQSDTSRDTTGSETSSGTIRRYQDVPTNEEFLDDFHNGFAGYIQDHLASGGVSQPAAAWLMSHEGLFLNQYLGQLDKIAASGQPIFRVVGANNNVRYLGARPGEVASEEIQNEQNARTQGNSTVNTGTNQDTTVHQNVRQYQNTQQGQRGTEQTRYGPAAAAPPSFAPTNVPQSIHPPAAPGTGTGGGTIPGQNNPGQLLPPQGSLPTPPPVNGENGLSQTLNTNTNLQQGEGANSNEMNRTQQTLQQTQQQRTGQTGTESTSGNTTRRSAQIEELYARDKIANVHVLSPTDFLSGMSPGALNVLYEGAKYTPRMDEAGGNMQAKLQVGGY